MSILYGDYTPPEVAEKLNDIIPDFSTLKVLDAGCGSGGFMVELARYAATVVGIEPDTYAFAVAEARGLDVQNKSIEELTAEDLADVGLVYIWFSLERAARAIIKNDVKKLFVFGDYGDNPLYNAFFENKSMQSAQVTLPIGHWTIHIWDRRS